MKELDHASRTHTPQIPLTREFLSQQLPLILVVFGLGIGAAYWQHGFLPGGTEAFPLAAVGVPILLKKRPAEKQEMGWCVQLDSVGHYV